MIHPAKDLDDRYDAIVAALLRAEGVTFGPPGTGFGASALKVNNKIFAMLWKGRLVVKLPRERVDTLIAAGDGQCFDPGHGRLMKEWLAVDPTSEVDWLALAREARAFVGSKSVG